MQPMSQKPLKQSAVDHENAKIRVMQALHIPQRSVLLVGNPALPLKGFDVAVAVLAAVNRVLPLDVTWICQSQPTAAMVPALPGSGLQLRLHISPSQVRVDGAAI